MTPIVNENNLTMSSDKKVPSRTKDLKMKLSLGKLRFTRQTTKRFESLSNDIIEYYNKSSVSAAKKEVVQRFLKVIHLKLRSDENFGPNTEIEPFGSMFNGMATDSSDLDISISLGDELNQDKDYKVSLLEKMIVPLEELGCTDIESILAAKVPIIKCKWIDSIHKIELEIDISIYNPLAFRNTALLRQYCLWDTRFPQLALYLKKFVKENEITGAYKRFLSSYALVIMLIKYLQEVNVLPCLQEDFRTDMDSDIMIEGYDSYFTLEINPNLVSNESNVAELFYGFLEFYVSYDFDKVINIERRKQYSQTSLRYDCNSAIAVQDPFMYKRNVAATVTTYTLSIIMEVFGKQAQLLRGEVQSAEKISSSNLIISRKRPCQLQSQGPDAKRFADYLSN